jgi:hypothetical protein
VITVDQGAFVAYTSINPAWRATWPWAQAVTTARRGTDLVRRPSASTGPSSHRGRTGTGPADVGRPARLLSYRDAGIQAGNAPQRIADASHRT